MDTVKSIVSTVKIVNATDTNNDYTQDGILYCGNCHTPKQVRIMSAVLPCACKCVYEKYEAERRAVQEREHAVQVERNRKETFNIVAFARCTFANDDKANPELSKLCRNYASRFKPDSKGLILYGGTGVGKTFMAACIANHVLETGNTVKFTTVSEFESKLWETQGKAGLYDAYAKCGLLVIDDIGAERDNKYMTEILFNLVDRRLRAGKPMVVTTNLEPESIFRPAGLAYERIMSRILECCVPYRCNGGDRRIKKAFDESKAYIENLLNDGES